MPRVHGVLDIIPVTPSFPASSDQNTPFAHDVTANSSQLFSLGLIIHPSYIYESHKNLSLQEIVYMAVWASVAMNHSLASECLWGGGCARRVDVAPMAIATSGECQPNKTTGQTERNFGNLDPGLQTAVCGGRRWRTPPPNTHPAGETRHCGQRGEGSKCTPHPWQIAPCPAAAGGPRTKRRDLREAVIVTAGPD